MFTLTLLYLSTKLKYIPNKVDDTICVFSFKNKSHITIVRMNEIAL